MSPHTAHERVGEDDSIGESLTPEDEKVDTEIVVGSYDGEELRTTRLHQTRPFKRK